MGLRYTEGESIYGRRGLGYQRDDFDTTITSVVSTTEPVTLAEANYANQNEAKRMMWENVVIPNLMELRDALNCWLVPQFGENIYIDFDTSNVKALQQDFDTQANAVLKLQGVLSVNELRDRLGYEPITGGDEIMPNNFASNFGQSVVGGATANQQENDGGSVENAE